MKIALLGYGRMGKAIEELAKGRGHEIVSIHDKDSNQGDISKADIEYIFNNYESTQRKFGLIK